MNEAARATSAVLLEAGKVLVSGTPEDILNHIPGVVGGWSGTGPPAPLSWRRGAGWRVWAPEGGLPDGARPVQPDFEDAVVVAALADELGR
jgi:hypothetical protein